MTGFRGEDESNQLLKVMYMEITTERIFQQARKVQILLFSIPLELWNTLKQRRGYRSVIVSDPRKSGLVFVDFDLEPVQFSGLCSCPLTNAEATYFEAQLN